MIAIKHRFSGTTLCEFDVSTVKEAVLLAIISGSDLSGSNLSGSDLSGSDLSGSDLSGSNLIGSDLSGSNLSGSDLSGSDLSGSNLSGSNLSGSNLSGSNLSGSNLRNSNLIGSDLSVSNLIGSDLSGSSLRGSDLSGSDLSGSNLRGSDLSGSNLRGIKNGNLALEKTSIVPEEGAFIGYKKLANGGIARLMIPGDAKRLNAYGSRKCRAEKAFVLTGEGKSKYDPSVIYAPLNWVIPDGFNDDRRDECSNGIHFFITRVEAEEY